MTDDSDLYELDLSSKKLLKVREYKGIRLVDIREYYPGKTAPVEMLPSKKGITLTSEQWKTVIENREAIELALFKDKSTEKSTEQSTEPSTEQSKSLKRKSDADARSPKKKPLTPDTISTEDLARDVGASPIKKE